MTKVKVATPVGELHWCSIKGQGKLNYNQDGYVYQASVFLSGEKAEELKAKIDEVIGTIPKGKNLKSSGYKDVYKSEEGKYFCESGNRSAGDGDEKTEFTCFTFTTRTTYEDGRPTIISIYNSGKKTEANPSGKPKKINLGDRGIGNGSLGAISGTLHRNENGKDISCSLFLKAIQITKYIEYSGDAGFDSQEDGDFEDVESDGTEGFAEDTTQEEKPAKEAKSKAKPRL
jgi:hypothetical protein